MRTTLFLMFVWLGIDSAVSLAAEDAKPMAPDFNTQVAPIFKKYCNGCHNADEKEGGLILESFDLALNGGKRGAVIVPGKSDLSRLVLSLEKKVKPVMPPEGNEGPKADEIAILKAWIDAGAKGPSGKAPDPTLLVTPKIATKGSVRQPIQSLAWSRDVATVAVARQGRAELLRIPALGDVGFRVPAPNTLVRELPGMRGVVNDIGMAHDLSFVFVAAGEPGVFGEVRLFKVADASPIRTLQGHRDAIYAAELSPDGKLLATGSYDQKVKLWNVETGAEVRTLHGHNDAVYDVAFHPNGQILASASGDRTVKLWNVATGERLDTLNQPEKEQYAVAFSLDGKRIVAGGVDKRIRVWDITAGGKEGTNPIAFSRYAHEGGILRLVFSPDGKMLVSSAEDRRIKLWETQSFTQLKVLETQPDWPQALTISPDSSTLLVGRLDGSMQSYAIANAGAGLVVSTPLTGDPVPPPSNLPASMQTVAEAEPNDMIAQAQPISLPATVSGKFAAAGDRDFFRFEAKAGQVWLLETNAARKGSPADTKIEVLTSDGRPVQRLVLQAVRETYNEFRPIDSNGPDIRLKNWEEMELNQFLYIGGEVLKTFRMPQGPDSGMQMYANGGKRIGYFDTSATIHALDEVCYIVEPYPVGTKLIDNGLPVFPLNYENDDDGERKLGNDSRLTFTAPADGTYLVKVTDTRGFGGDKHEYSLTVRPPLPTFTPSLAGGKDATVAASSGTRVTFQIDRAEGFDGDVRFEVTGLPEGFAISTPTVVQAGHLQARAVLSTSLEAKEKAPPKEAWANVKITATATIHGQLVTKEAGTLGEIKLADKPKFLVNLSPDRQPLKVADSSTAPPTDTPPKSDEIPELIIAPGTTITAMLRIERFNDFKNEQRFDIDNLPHGVIVDNIGLSGVMIRQGETERQIFLTASSWVPESSRLIYGISQQEGNQASRPVRLIVRSAR
ncbi:MAG: c-type cytochrome domain-containing protein [Planctomycetaceae bacterium]